MSKLPVEFLRTVPAEPERPKTHWLGTFERTSQAMKVVAFVDYAINEGAFRS